MVRIGYHSFNDAYIVEMYLDNIEGFEGQKEMMTRFGLDMQDEATWVVSKRRFEQLISTGSKFDCKFST